MWGVERDSSLTKDKIGCCLNPPSFLLRQGSLKDKLDGVELVSPVLFDDWPNTLEKVMGIITDAFTIIEDSSAGTHVHVAPFGRPWSDAELKQISKGIVAWSALFEQLMPRPSRNKYAKWNLWITKSYNYLKNTFFNILYYVLDSLPKYRLND